MLTAVTTVRPCLAGADIGFYVSIGGTLASGVYTGYMIAQGSNSCDKIVRKKRNLTELIRDNHQAILTDLGSGAGEALDSVADLAGIPAAQRFGKYLCLQAQVATIFPQQSLPPEHIASEIAALL